MLLSLVVYWFIIEKTAFGYSLRAVGFNKDGAEYRRLAAGLAMQWAPPIYQCQKCWHPVIDGYCCSFCGDENPKTPAANRRSRASKNGDSAAAV